MIEGFEEIKTKMLAMREAARKNPPKLIEYDCPVCKDSRIITRIDEDGVERASVCQCVQLEQARRIMRQSGLSDIQRSVTFNGYQTFGNRDLENAKQKAISYYRGFLKIEKTEQNSILLCGQVGAGKTHLGIAISNNLMDQRIPVIYMPYRNAITALKQNIMDEEGYAREMNKYLNARVLYIDDLLKGQPTESDRKILFEIINHRYINGLPMIITTEARPEALIDFDEAIGSRILERSRGNIVVFRGSQLNYRLRGLGL
ncbi:MAG: ATP-binding protein [Eubacterium sp.]|nr:ATP-binding protein [Eubacterium sp.]